LAAVAYRQENDIVIVNTIQHDIGAATEPYHPFAECRVHLGGRTTGMRLAAQYMDAAAYCRCRSLRGAWIAGRKKAIKPLHIAGRLR
jgi:hypothetical protein